MPVQRPGALTLIKSDYQSGEVTRLCEQMIAQNQSAMDQLVANPRQGSKNALEKFDQIMTDFNDATSPLAFMGSVSTNGEIAQEGSTCEEKLGQYTVSLMARKDLYDVLVAVNPGRRMARLKSEVLRDFENNGLKLPEAERLQIKNLKTQLAGLEAQFQANLNRDTSVVEFEASELEGVPESVLARFTKNAQGMYVVTTKPSDFVALMENAKKSETRRKMAYAYDNRQSATNKPLLEQAIELRANIAKKMGFNNWGDYRMQGRMAADSVIALRFLNSLKSKLSQRTQRDLARLLAYKQELTPGQTVRLDPWDIRYLETQIKKRDYQLDTEAIREYFPATHVVPMMFEIYSTLLGVRYQEVTDANVWAEGVKLYKILQGRGEAAKTIGYFFADFYPRENKYSHAAAFTLISGRKLADGSYSKPVSSIVANFTPGSGDKPSLLSHDEVETLFHEFGHIMHQTLTRAEFGLLSGSSTARDFVEAPSQMLENWVWDREMLKKISGHYQNLSQKLPDALITQMLSARDFNRGYFYTRQLHFGLMDMEFHTAAPGASIDSTAVYERLLKELLGLDMLAGTHMPATFGHLMGGYDAGYYGYLWSEVYAQDMFTKFKAGGLLSPQVGGRYRRAVLERGNMVDGFDLLRGFLGRNPSDAAFFRDLGVTQ